MYLTQKQERKKKESSYQNLLVGILTGNADWLVKSNVEGGICRYYCETDDPDAGIVIELKYTKSFDENGKTACQKALDQIQDRRYQEFLINDDRKDIHLYGITFCKKRCRANGSNIAKIMSVQRKFLKQHSRAADQIGQLFFFTKKSRLEIYM